MAGTKVQTKVGALRWAFIKGEGRNGAMPGEEPRMQYMISLVCKKDSETHKHIMAQIDGEWSRYKTDKGVKGLPDTNGTKEEMVNDPKGEIDPKTEEIKKIPSGNIIITFKTNILWPNGNPRVVKVKNNKGADITEAYNKVNWSIGEGSEGIIFGTAMGNNVGGKHKVSLYLTAVQLAKLVRYEGDDVECEDLGGDDISIDDEVAAIDMAAESQPDL